MDYSLLFCVEKNYDYYNLKRQAERIVRERYQNQDIIVEGDFEEEVRQAKHAMRDSKTSFIFNEF